MKKIVEEFVRQIEINRNYRKAKNEKLKSQIISGDKWYNQLYADCLFVLCEIFCVEPIFEKKKVDEEKKNFLMRNFVLVILF